MSRVAIIGSCISRDLWPRRAEGLANLHYVARTSLPSLFAPPAAGFRPRATPPVALNPFPHRALVADLRKTALADLIAFEPTHLIFDFIDERFDLLESGGSLFLDSWELEASGYLSQRAFRGVRRIDRFSPASDRLWRRGAEQMAAFVRATPLRDASLILHVSRWAERQRDARGVRRPMADVELKSGRPADIAQHNHLLAAYEAQFLELMPPMHRVEADRLADETHQWGLSPFHFTPDYYAAIWRQLEPLSVEIEPSGQRAEPSAPAA